jgi:hypothetical protein
MLKPICFTLFAFLIAVKSSWCKTLVCEASEKVLPTEYYPFDQYTSFTPIINRYNLGSWKVKGNALWPVEKVAFEAVRIQRQPKIPGCSWISNATILCSNLSLMCQKIAILEFASECPKSRLNILKSKVI